MAEYTQPDVDYTALEVGDVVIEADGTRVRYTGPVDGIMRWERVGEDS